jgi:hypothetical protein
MRAYLRHHSSASPARSRAKPKSAKAKKGFVPRVIDGGKGAHSVASTSDERGARLIVKGAPSSVEALLLFMEMGASGLDTTLSSVAVTDCETGLTDCFNVDFTRGMIAEL